MSIGQSFTTAKAWVAAAAVAITAAVTAAVTAFPDSTEVKAYSAVAVGTVATVAAFFATFRAPYEPVKPPSQ